MGGGVDGKGEGAGSWLACKINKKCYLDKKFKKKCGSSLASCSVFCVIYLYKALFDQTVLLCTPWVRGL